ncbi:MAG: hypothetical protein OXC03_11210 [Flavobacteriaceae bacterium]|nr:hypothetical protein [Flavobacteriaceae bacterium]
MKKTESSNFLGFINKKLEQYKYSFSIDELKDIFIQKKQKDQIKEYLKQYEDKKYIFALLEDFYLIIPPEERCNKQIELMNYIEDFAFFLEKKDKYYVSWFTASRYHGACHQMYFYFFLSINEVPEVLKEKYYKEKKKTEKNIIYIDQGYYGICIVINRDFPPKQTKIIPPKTEPIFSADSGYIGLKGITPKYPIYQTDRKNIWRKESVEYGYGFNFSSPSLTAIDFIHDRYHGGISGILSNIQELSEEMTIDDIEELLSWYPHKHTIQRFGFLMELLSENASLIPPIRKHMEKIGLETILLSTEKEVTSQYIDRERHERIKKIAKKWQIKITFILDNDLDWPDCYSTDKIEFYEH